MQLNLDVPLKIAGNQQTIVAHLKYQYRTHWVLILKNSYFISLLSGKHFKKPGGQLLNCPR